MWFVLPAPKIGHLKKLTNVTVPALEPWRRISQWIDFNKNFQSSRNTTDFQTSRNRTIHESWHTIREWIDWKISIQPRTMEEWWHRIREWIKLKISSPDATGQILVDKSHNRSSRLMLHSWISCKQHQMEDSNPNNLADHFSILALSKFTAQENKPEDNQCNWPSRFNSESMTFECKESCWHMKLLHDCKATKDAMLLCKKDETFIPMHKVVAAHGSPHLRQLFHKLKPGIVNGLCVPGTGGPCKSKG